MIQKPKSIAKQLDVSPFAAELFVANRAQCGESVMITQHIRDFSYAPPRFCVGGQDIGKARDLL